MSLHESDVKPGQSQTVSPVTAADLAVNNFLHENLLKIDPTFGWLSEETVDDLARTACDHTWVVDPIDGTKSFLAGGDQWCISVALVKNGRPSTGLRLSGRYYKSFIMRKLAKAHFVMTRSLRFLTAMN